MTDLTIALSYGDALQLRVYLERERLRQRKDGLNHRAVDRLIGLVEQALFPHAERDYSADELVQIRRQAQMPDDDPDEEGPPPDINREGLPEFNGSFR